MSQQAFHVAIDDQAKATRLAYHYLWSGALGIGVIWVALGRLELTRLNNTARLGRLGLIGDEKKTMGNDDANTLRWAQSNPVTAYILAGVLSGTGVNGLWGAIKDYRPDPWTGTDAKAAEQRSIVRDQSETRDRKNADDHIRYRLQSVEELLGKLHARVEAHHLEAEGWKERIRRCCQ